MDNFDAILNLYVDQSARILIQSEMDRDLAIALANNPREFNGKFRAADEKRIMKCPRCERYTAVAESPEHPYICECGWQSDKPNGKVTHET